MVKAKKQKSGRNVVLGLSAVIVAVQEGAPKVFIVRGAEHALAATPADADARDDALPFGPFDPAAHPTLEAGLRGWIGSQTPIRPGYVEQLYTFGNRDRYAGRDAKGARVISVGYLALTYNDSARTTGKVFWGDWYDYFPWEDVRTEPRLSKKEYAALIIGLRAWASETDDPQEKFLRRLRAQACFGLEDAPWDAEKVLERYELLYEARLVYESVRDKNMVPDRFLMPGRPMQFDHRRILATAMSRLRGKLKYRPVAFELLPERFTLLQLQTTVEAIMGHTLRKQNFRRMVERSGMVEEIYGRKSAASGGRPAALFRFRESVVMERPAPGMKVSPRRG